MSPRRFTANRMCRDGPSTTPGIMYDRRMNERSGRYSRWGGTLWAMTMLSNAAFAQHVAAAPLPVKVLVVNLFGLEADPWLKALRPDREYRVPGLPADSPSVRCNQEEVCQMTTDMGHANAAASMMAVMYSGLFDLRKTYFLVAGIAGIDPARGTLGSVAWARYVVDAGISHVIDARELPAGWHDGSFGVFTDSPAQVPKFEYHSEMFQLDEALLVRALELSKGAVLVDGPELQTYRRHYPDSPANQPPAVIQCDTLSSDTWWVGDHPGEHARSWTRLLTGGKGVYCTSLHGGATIAAQNLVRAGMPLIDAIVGHWDRWQAGAPTAAAQ
jgi:purine nucleoside permease